MTAAVDPLAGLPAQGAVTPDLPSGKGMTFQEAERLTLRDAPQVVVLLGPPECGKTTLLSSLELLFQQGPFADYLFGGSETLVGFEERNYLATIASQQAEADTDRTTVTELLHLAVRRTDLGREIDHLLLCDMAAEDIEEAKDSTDACSRLTIINRADRVVFLVDGDKLVDLAVRQKAVTDVVSLFRNCLDSGVLRHDSLVDVVVTKWDRIPVAPKEAATEKFIERKAAEMVRLFGGRCGNITIYRVAARAKGPDFELGYGMKELFRSWIEGSSASTISNDNEVPRLFTEFDRYRVG